MTTDFTLHEARAVDPSSVDFYIGLPPTPQNLSATGVSSDTIDLDWDAVSPRDEYRIYRDTSSGVETSESNLVATTTSTSYTDSGLDLATEYHYTVTSYLRGAESDPATEDSAETQLEAPSDFTVVDTRVTETDVEWSYDGDGHDGFRAYIRYDTTEDSFSEIEEFGPEARSGTITGVRNGREFSAYLVAYVEQESDPSNTDTGETPLPEFDSFAIDASVQSVLTVQPDDVLNSGWYRIEYRDDDPDGDHPDYEFETDLGHDVSPLEHDITGLVDGEQYSIRIRLETPDNTGEWLEASPITKLIPASDVEIVDTTTDGATVAWVNESDFRGSNLVYRRRTDYDYGDDPGRLVGTVAEDDDEFVDESGQPDREYEYAVRALTQWVYAYSDPSDPVTTDSIGLEQRSVPSDKPYIEIDHPNRSAPLTPEVETIQRQPTINGYPRLSFTTPPDERWLDDELDDAEIRAWINGERQPIDVLEHRDQSPESIDCEARGGTQLDRRVVENVDIEEALPFAEYLIEEYTDYVPVVDDPDDVVREDVLLQQAHALAELQAAFEEIADDVALKWDGDELVRLQSCWLFDPIDQGVTPISGDEFIGGEAGHLEDFTANFSVTFQTAYDIEEPELVYRGDREEYLRYDVLLDGTVVDDDTNPSFAFPGYHIESIDGPLGAGTHTLEVSIDPDDEAGSGDLRLDRIGIRDGQFDYDDSGELDEPGGNTDGPAEYPLDPEHLALEEINTPLSIVEATLSVGTNDADGIEIGLREDGTGDYVTTTGTNLTVEYDELQATVQGRVGLGGREDLEPRDATPRLGYEPQALDEVELRADLDETPVVVNYQPDKKAIDVLREVVGDIADGAFEIRPGPDGIEVHVSRIDGRPSDVDPDLIDWSLERNTEDTVDRAIVYAGAEAIRRLPFQADVDEWADLPLGPGRIVRGSETVYDATDDEESLERGEDYEIIPNNPDGSPQIKLLTDLNEPRIDCDFKPRGEHEAADLPEEPSVIIEDAPNLASQQMADIAAFQAVEGSYTDAIIDASISAPVDQISWNVLDALNVADLPGDQPYQIKDGDSDPASGDYRLGAGRTGQEEIQQLNDETGRLSERV